MTYDRNLTGPTCVVGTFTASKMIFYTLDETNKKTEYRILLFKDIRGKNNSYHTLPGGKRKYLETPWQTMERELSEEMLVNFSTDMVVYATNSMPYKVQIFGLNILYEPFKIEVRGEIGSYKWVTLHDAEILTNGFWKESTLLSYINEIESYYATCPECRKPVCVQSPCTTFYEMDEYGNQVFYHNSCGEKRRQEEEAFDDLVDDYCDDRNEDDSYDECDDDPCSDCDDKKMPYAERSCEECPHGGKGCLGRLDPEIEMDAEDDWILDMYGANAVNRKHGKKERFK